MTRFEETILIGDPALRGETPMDIRSLQMLYRQSQAQQLVQQIKAWGLNPDEIEYYQASFEKNLCPGTGFESEGGILYNRRTGVSVPVLLEWVCQWNCGLPQWRGQYKPKVETCQPTYFFTSYLDDDIAKLR
ncbi:hypothetical protein [Candidatus Chlorohelix sp.]|uniref:hypothetical protein n=1 Tax=Candidatus Chlorohelix sp. TaxID=3139201 RepID=UPI003040358F